MLFALRARRWPLAAPTSARLGSGKSAYAVPNFTDPNRVATMIPCLPFFFRHNHSDTSINPRPLFSAVCDSIPQFRGYQQQDSQELLRALLDCLDEEDKTRISASILRQAGVEPASVVDAAAVRACLKGLDEATRRRVKVYIDSCPTYVDNVFGGRIASTVTCTHCGVVSRTVEPFLDLSMSLGPAAAAGRVTLASRSGRKGSTAGKGGAKVRKPLQLTTFESTGAAAAAAATAAAPVAVSDSLPLGGRGAGKQPSGRKNAPKEKTSKKTSKVSPAAPIADPDAGETAADAISEQSSVSGGSSVSENSAMLYGELATPGASVAASRESEAATPATTPSRPADPESDSSYGFEAPLSREADTSPLHSGAIAAMSDELAVMAVIGSAPAASLGAAPEDVAGQAQPAAKVGDTAMAAAAAAGTTEAACAAGVATEADAEAPLTASQALWDAGMSASVPIAEAAAPSRESTSNVSRSAPASLSKPPVEVGSLVDPYVPRPGESSLESCLAHFTREELLDGECFGKHVALGVCTRRPRALFCVHGSGTTDIALSALNVLCASHVLLLTGDDMFLCERCGAAAASEVDLFSLFSSSSSLFSRYDALFAKLSHQFV